MLTIKEVAEKIYQELKSTNQLGLLDDQGRYYQEYNEYHPDIAQLSKSGDQCRSTECSDKINTWLSGFFSPGGAGYNKNFIPISPIPILRIDVPDTDISMNFTYDETSEEITIDISTNSDRSLKYTETIHSQDFVDDTEIGYPTLAYYFDASINDLPYQYIKKHLLKPAIPESHSNFNYYTPMGDVAKKSPSSRVLWPVINRTDDSEWRLSEEWKQLTPEMATEEQRKKVIEELQRIIGNHNSGGGLYGKRAMIMKLVKIANKLDSIGEHEFSNILDGISGVLNA